MERNNTGHTTVRRIQPTPELQRLRASWPLSRLRAMVHLGAVPDV